METKPIIYLVDDEDTFRDGLAQLLTITGLDVEGYASAEKFLEKYNPERPGCLVLDIDMPGMDGLQLQKLLNERDIRIPIIFITGYGDVPKTVQALKGGAVDFLEKPFRKEVILELIHSAIDNDAEKRKGENEKTEILNRYRCLTKRRQDIMYLIVSGHSNKEIGQKLSISFRTVEVHRKKIMDRMKAKSVADLVNMAHLCGIDVQKPQETK